MGLWYSEFDGDRWEGMCDSLLALKHGADYQPICDKGGDLGLDGLTIRHGIVYQAYGQEPENKDPVNGVRTKISKDLLKLKKYESDIVAIIGEKKIKDWILLLNKEIPHNDLHAFAKKKEMEVLSWGLSFIDPDFKVSIQPPSYFDTEYMEFNKRRHGKVEVAIELQPVPALENLRKNANFKSVFEKFRRISDTDEDAERLAYGEVKNFIENSIQLNEIQKREPEFFSEIEEVRSDIEHDAEQGSLAVGSYDSFSNTKTTLENRLNFIVGNRLGASTLSRVRKFIIADWLVRCPLNFKNKGTTQ